MTIGDRLKLIRKENKISFEQAASQSGVVRSMIQRWEKGQSTAISSEYLTFIYNLGYSLEWIFFDKKPYKRIKDPEERKLITDISEILIRLDVQEATINYLMKRINRSSEKEIELIKNNIKSTIKA